MRPKFCQRRPLVVLVTGFPEAVEPVTASEHVWVPVFEKLPGIAP